MNILISRAIAALKEKDHIAFAACFSKNGKYSDYCPSSNGSENWAVYGRAGIELFFKNRFAFDHLTVSEPVVENGVRASFFGAYDGPYLYAMFEIQELSEDGLIQRAVAYPVCGGKGGRLYYNGRFKWNRRLGNSVFEGSRTRYGQH